MDDFFQQYENSITRQAERSMNQWARELAYMNDELMNDPMRIVDSLNDVRNICTPGFLMRRQIQKSFPDYLEKASEESKEIYADLFVSENTPWPDALIKSLCSKLTKYAKTEYDQTITTTQWRDWLTDKHTPAKRELAIKLSFLLDMDDYTTTKFLLSCGHEPFSVRNPLDCICLFCKQLRPKGDWKKVEEILFKYEANRPEPSGSKSGRKQSIGNPGMTHVMKGMIPELAKTSAPEYQLAELQNGLIEYMYSINDEFTSIKKTYEKKGKGNGDSTENKKTYKKNENSISQYASGYSLERCQRLLELTRFLAVLYPEYDDAVYSGGDRRVDSRRKKMQGAEALITEIIYSKENMKNVQIDADGYPNLYDLPKAFVYTHEWDFAEASGLGLVEFDKETGKAKTKTSKMKETHDREIPFNWEIYRICHAYSEDKRLARISLLPGQTEIDLPIERKDILLLAFLFISAYSRWWDSHVDTGTSDLYEKLIEMIKEESADDIFATEIRSLIGQIDDVVNMCDEDAKIAGYISCVNKFLELFEYESFYPPFLFDRFILFALVAEEIGSTALGEDCLPVNLTSIWLYDGYADMPEYQPE